MKKQLCNRCKRDIYWEEKEMERKMDKEQLIKLINAYRIEFNKCKGVK